MSVALLLTILEIVFRCRDRRLKHAGAPSSFAPSALFGVPRLLPRWFGRSNDALEVFGPSNNTPTTAVKASLGSPKGSGMSKYGWLSDTPTPGNRFLGLVNDGAENGGRKSMV